MKITNNSNYLGMTSLAMFLICTGSFLLSLSEIHSAEMTLKPGPIDPAIVKPAEDLGRAFAMVANHVRPSVVSVYSEKTITFTQREFPFPFGDDLFDRFFGGEDSRRLPQPREYRRQQRGMGSGMILDVQGHILTNFHVVQNVDDVKVQLADKRTFEAEIIGSDEKTDVAILKLKGRLPEDLPPVTLGNSDALSVGNLVLAVGAPFGLTQTVTDGIISAVSRSDVGIVDYEDFIQTDAPINPGNSGGPLVNMRGEVIGMNSAIATNIGQSAGVGFSIPSNMIKAMLPRLIKGQAIIRGQLGVIIQDLTEELAKAFGLEEYQGVLVSQVNEDSAAQKAGIEAGDVIKLYDGNVVTGVRELRNMVAETPPGKKVRIEVIRNNEEKRLTATIGTAPTETMANSSFESKANALNELGLSVQTLTPELANQFGVLAEKGVVITGVNQGSAASLAQLQEGDVIVEAGRRLVANVSDLSQALAKAKDKGRILLRISRKNSGFFVVLSLD